MFLYNQLSSVQLTVFLAAFTFNWKKNDAMKEKYKKCNGYYRDKKELVLLFPKTTYKIFNVTYTFW